MKDKGKKISRSAVWAAAGAVVIFCLIFYAVITGSAAAFDDPVREFFYSMRCDYLDPVMKFITYMGNPETVTALCIILLLWKRTRMDYGVPVSFAAASVSLLNKAIKHIVERPRPDDIVHLVEEGGFSFPSGHSITSMMVFGLLIYLVRSGTLDRKKADILTVVLAVPMIFIGISRIYVGVHYPTDVLAGWCLALAMLVLMISALGKMKGRKR